MNGVPWSEAELAAVRAAYTTGDGLAAARGALPHRSAHAIQVKASRLGVAADHWSDAELATLRREWHEVSARTLRAKLPGRTWCAIYLRAKKLGLPLGIPQGRETLHAAARRTGFAGDSLRRVLRWAGVRAEHVYPGPSRSVYRRGECMRHLDPDEVDAAVRAWLATECVGPAARSRGVSEDRLCRWLRATGALPPPRPRGQATHMRVPSEVIDAVVAAHRRAA